MLQQNVSYPIPYCDPIILGQKATNLTELQAKMCDRQCNPMVGSQSFMMLQFDRREKQSFKNLSRSEMPKFTF